MIVLVDFHSKLNVGVCSVLLGTLVILQEQLQTLNCRWETVNKKAEGVVATTEVDEAKTPNLLKK